MFSFTVGARVQKITVCVILIWVILKVYSLEKRLHNTDGELVVGGTKSRVKGGSVWESLNNSNYIF